MNQLSFLDIDRSKPTGRTLRDKGEWQALRHANKMQKEWQQHALDFLRVYAQKHDQFACEEVRDRARGFVPTPPSLRAWGSIFVIAEVMEYLHIKA